MIEVNLLPGGKKRSKGGGGLSLPLPDLSKLPADPFSVAAAVIGVGVVAALLWMNNGIANDQEEVAFRLQQALADSANFADLIERNQALQARRDSVASKVAVIQEIDAGRFTWPHIIDEIGRALPDFTWLTQIVSVGIDTDVQVEIQGRVGNPIALTTFMQALEESPFIRGVSMEGTEQITETDPSGNQQLVYSFVLRFGWEEPPPEILETVPLFQDMSTLQAQVDTAGSPDGGAGNEQDG